MPKIEIIIQAKDTERDVVEAWLAKWSNILGERPENEGCGCCVDIYKLEAPWEAINELPKEFFNVQ